jgi:Uma2 family endonuclease
VKARGLVPWTPIAQAFRPAGFVPTDRANLERRGYEDCTQDYQPQNESRFLKRYRDVEAERQMDTRGELPGVTGELRNGNPCAVRPAHANPRVMNQLTNIPVTASVSRRRFTAVEFEAMAAGGIFGPDERVELMAGEVVTMLAEGALHLDLRSYLGYFWSRRAPERGFVIVEAPIQLGENYTPVADITVFPFGLLANDRRGTDAWIVVEIADTSLDYDLSIKLPAYAAGGVREYWVINARTRSTLVHREPQADGTYAVTLEVAADAVATPLLVPELAVRMSELPGG